MRKLYFGLVVSVLFSSCLGYKELPVEYDYSYKGTFKRYSTFDIMKSVGVNDSSSMNRIIRESIVSRMKFLGYRQRAGKPHIIIGFKMFEDSLRFRGYNQPDIETWVRGQNDDIDYTPHNFNLSTGTLLIQFYDRRQNRSIWQGYATTTYGSIDYSNTRHIRNAVISILDKYRFWAEGFLEGNNSQEEAGL